jgi:hypothetical protein
MTRSEAIKHIVKTYSSNCDECHDDYQVIEFIFTGKIVPMDLCEPCFKEITEIMEALNINKKDFIVNHENPY